jgi:7-cyano-7-deazaguanine synthase in queuosine biosynthesis
MIIPHSKQELDIRIPRDVINVGLKISGGLDSAIVGYILSKYVTEERPDVGITPITVDQEGKAYQIQFAKNVIEYYKTVFGDIYTEHYTGFSPMPEEENYVIAQDKVTKRLYAENKIQFHFAGITANPPQGSIEQRIYDQGFLEPPDRDPSKFLKSIYVDSNRCLPLINFNKQHVSELYDYFDLQNTLFPLTRSCEQYTDDFTQHCNNCWFCGERKWGFGRL